MGRILHQFLLLNSPLESFIFLTGSLSSFSQSHHLPHCQSQFSQFFQMSCVWSSQRKQMASLKGHGHTALGARNNEIHTAVRLQETWILSNDTSPNSSQRVNKLCTSRTPHGMQLEITDQRSRQAKGSLSRMRRNWDDSHVSREFRGSNADIGKVIRMLINGKELQHKFFSTIEQVLLVAKGAEETDQIAKAPFNSKSCRCMTSLSGVFLFLFVLKSTTLKYNL